MYFGSFDYVFSYINNIPYYPPTRNDLLELGRNNKDSIEKFYPGLPTITALNSPLTEK
jgi:hypothetical protein